MPRVYYGNGKIFTGQDETSFVSAFAVEAGKIVWLGETADIAGPFIDLAGKTVVPGFIDSHIHPVYVSRVQNQVACMPPKVYSIKDMIEELKQAADTSRPDDWIDGWGYDESKLVEGRTPNRYDLDKVSESQPVQVIRSCFHARVINSKALEICGIDRDTPDPADGIIDRDETGEPTGILYEAAHWQVENFRPAITPQDQVEAISRLSDRLSEFGITGAAEVLALPGYDEMYRQAQAKGFKQHIALYYKYSDDFLKIADQLHPTTDPKENVRLCGIKYVLDGSISGHTALMKQAYPGTQDYGTALGSEDELNDIYQLAQSKGWQIIIHAMGDQAIQQVIDFFKNKPGWLNGVPSVRIEHASILDDAMIEAIRQAEIGLTMNINFLFAEYDSWRANLDDRRFAMATRLASCYPAIEYLALASDSPATLWAIPEDVFLSLKAAVTRRAYEGQDINQKERISLAQAILLYTKKAAVVCNIPLTGQLIPGYFADFAVLDRDIFSLAEEDIDQVKVEQTFIKGDCVYQRTAGG